MSEQDPRHRFVTNGELQEELKKRPTSWEVRTLILMAVVANQLIPTLNLGPNPTSAAIHYVMGVIPL